MTLIVITIWINVSSVTVVNVILELSFVDDMVDFFTDALNSAIWANLTNDELVESALA